MPSSVSSTRPDPIRPAGYPARSFLLLLGLVLSGAGLRAQDVQPAPTAPAGPAAPADPAAPPTPAAPPAPPVEQGTPAQRELLSSEVVVSDVEATLRVHFSEGLPLEISVRSGRLFVEGSDIDAVLPGGALERSWRELLGAAITADPPELASLLRQWRPPPALPLQSEAAAEVMGARIGEALTDVRPPAPRPGGIRVHVDESLTVGPDEVVPFPLLLLGGELRVEGTIDGDVVVAGGRLELAPGARITGDVRGYDAEIQGDRSGVDGIVEERSGVGALSRVVPSESEVAPPPSGPAELGEMIREEVRRWQESSGQGAVGTRGPRDGRSSAFARIGSGFAGLFRTLLTFAILLGTGLALLHFLPDRIEVIARTARSSSGRSALVGMAGVVLALPLWIVGMLLLAVSIIGIPILVLWIPALPLALAVAILVGYLAVARTLGGRMSGRGWSRLGGLELGGPVGQVGLGLAVLLAAFALASVLEMGGPWFGVFQGVLIATGVILTALAICVGLGAVILSRAGQDLSFTGGIRTTLTPDPAIDFDGGPGDG